MMYLLSGQISITCTRYVSRSDLYDVFVNGQTGQISIAQHAQGMFPEVTCMMYLLMDSQTRTD